MIKIDTHFFYKIGIWCFGIMAIMNTMSYVVTFKNVSLITEHISGFASLVFNYAIFGFFLYLYRSLPPKNQVEMSQEEWEKVLTESH